MAENAKIATRFEVCKQVLWLVTCDCGSAVGVVLRRLALVVVPVV